VNVGHVRREFTKVLFQKRTYIGWGGLFVLPFIFALAFRFSGDGPGPHGEGGDALDMMMMQGVKSNGLYLGLLALFMLATFLLPLLACMAGSQTVAGEAEKGTLRTALMQPVKRSGILLAKWAVANIYMVIGLAILWVACLTAGVAFFGLHPLGILTGGTLSAGASVLWTFLAYAYVAVGMLAVVSVAVLLSTLTESSLTAAAGALVLVIVMLVLGNLSALEFLRPYLITSHLSAWGNFFERPLVWGPIWKGLICFGAWGAGTMGLSLWWFGRKDIVS
jgi:ABC-2 type transport system permease protein